jgi:hypothetical protein
MGGANSAATSGVAITILGVCAEENGRASIALAKRSDPGSAAGGDYL